MPDTFQIYQSELTGPELDEALQNIALVQQSVAGAAQSAAAAGGSAADAAQAAQTAETYGAIVQQKPAGHPGYCRKPGRRAGRGAKRAERAKRGGFG